MSTNLPAALFEFANFLADEAAKISRKYFRQPLLIDSKESLVIIDNITHS